jgi:hypothetical protein
MLNQKLNTEQNDEPALEIINTNVPFRSPLTKLVVSSKSHPGTRTYDDNCRLSMTIMVGYCLVPGFSFQKNDRRKCFTVNDLKNTYFYGRVWHAIRFIY